MRRRRTSTEPPAHSPDGGRPDARASDAAAGIQDSERVEQRFQPSLQQVDLRAQFPLGPRALQATDAMFVGAEAAVLMFMIMFISGVGDRQR